jgi:type II secretion system protein H
VSEPSLGRTAARRAGFTLVELLGVVIVLGLIATLVTVNWQALLPRQQLNSAVRALAATLQGARSDAIARTLEFRVQYDLDEQRYRVLTPFRLGGGLATVEDERVGLRWTELPDSVRFRSVIIGDEEYTSGIVQISFDPLGSANGHVVVLEQPAFESLYTIEVQALTGLITFHEGLELRPAPAESDFE